MLLPSVKVLSLSLNTSWALALYIDKCVCAISKDTDINEQKSICVSTRSTLVVIGEKE